MSAWCSHSYCTERKFVCTSNECDAVCGIYGDGHYTTFDDKRFDFNGQCEYTLLQVYECSTPMEHCVKMLGCYIGNEASEGAS